MNSKDSLMTLKIYSKNLDCLTGLWRYAQEILVSAARPMTWRYGCGQQEYGDILVFQFGDFQARRTNIRFKREGRKGTEFYTYP